MPVLQNLLPLLPRRVGNLGPAVAAGLSVAGCALWIAGARFSRPLLAFAAALAGALIGFQSPRWFGWTIDPWALAVLGSLLLGIFGFMAHGLLAAAGLGLVLASWATLAILSAAGLSDKWEWPAISSSDVLSSFLTDMQRSIPTHLAIILLYAGGLALVVGLAFGLVCRRLGAVFFWTLLGLSMILFSALSALQSAGPRYAGLIPPRPAAQGVLLAALIILGAAIQWKIAFAKRAPKRAANSPAPAA